MGLGMCGATRGCFRIGALAAALAAAIAGPQARCQSPARPASPPLAAAAAHPIAAPARTAVSPNSGSAAGLSVRGPSAADSGPAPTVQPKDVGPIENYYGSNRAGAYQSTAAQQGPFSTEPDSSVTAPGQNTPPANGSLPTAHNLNSETYMPMRDGTGEPLRAPTLAEPPATSTIAETPQESTSALAWSAIGFLVLIVGIFGVIKVTQPGGVA